MKNKDTSNAKVSLLEKVLINWATPLEGLIVWPIYRSKVGSARPKFQEYFDKYGVFRGMWESKITDYQRLLNNTSESSDVSEDILKLFRGTPCGYVMTKVYKNLR